MAHPGHQHFFLTPLGCPVMPYFPADFVSCFRSELEVDASHDMYFLTDPFPMNLVACQFSRRWSCAYQESQTAIKSKRPHIHAHT